MRALGFRDQFGDAVLDGRKPFTLRRAWKRPETMPDVGDMVSIVTGWRTKQRRVRGFARVAFRCGVTFNRDGIVSHTGWRTAPVPVTPQAFVVIHALNSVDSAAAGLTIARLDGFQSYDAFWAFHDRHRARRADTTVMAREMIGFDRLIREDAG